VGVPAVQLPVLRGRERIRAAIRARAAVSLESITVSVESITDEELVRRALLNTRLKIGEPRWAATMRVFGLGSTYAAQLCRRFGLEPDEVKK